MPRQSDTARDNVADWNSAQERWGASFKRERAASGRSWEQVALAVGVLPKTLHNWVDVNTRLDPAYVIPLADAVGASAVEWAEILGFVPQGLLRAGQSLEESRRRLRDVERRVAALETKGRGTALIVEAATASGRWTTTVAPWFEGPSACRLRRGDLITISAVDAKMIRARDIRDDSQVGAALTTSGAVRQPAAVWLKNHRPGADPQRDLRAEWLWAVPYLNVSKPRADVPRRLGLPSVAVFSTHSSAWTSSIALLVGKALGFGHVSAGVLSRLTLGEEIRDDLLSDPDGDAFQNRAAIAADLLGDPYGVANHLVWAHDIVATPQPVLEQLTLPRPAPLVIWIHGTDRLHEYVAHRLRGADTLGELTARRTELDSAMANTTLPTMTLNAGFPSDLDPAGPLTTTIRDAFFERSIIAALQVLIHLRRNYGGPALDNLHADCPPPFRSLAERFASATDGDAIPESFTPHRTFA